ncbi:MAG TPA: flagellar hook protein FlgE [Bryobacteraceae bacterium]|jgi:flagellar hook protein FlgE|nr:flagellar hook protein FlgE [Bryobacteraceae bacterium]
MGAAFSNALSGLTANALAIDVVSGNLANQNTFGYKANEVSFEDLVTESLAAPNGSNLVGGSAIPISNRSFSQGSVTSTGQPYDAAIQGNGFFVLKTTTGQQAFTRAGNFTVDSTGHLLTQNGDSVEGWNAVNGVLNTNANTTDIVLPVAGLRQPSATTAFSLNLNLNANAAVGSADGSFSSPMQVVDSEGTTHVLTVNYTKSTAGSWDYTISMPPGDLNNPGNPPGALASGTLTFDSNGHLASPAVGAGAIPVTISSLSDGAADMNLTWNAYDSTGTAQITQFDQASANLGSSQDGVLAGQLTGISIGTNGQLTATYSNGDNIAVAQLAVGSVLNPGSMADLGDNNFGVTSATAVPSIGVPGTGSRGGITGGAIESSTVDIAKEFTNLLVYERGYQANSKVVTTEDQVVQTTLALITP